MDGQCSNLRFTLALNEPFRNNNSQSLSCCGDLSIFMNVRNSNGSMVLDNLGAINPPCGSLQFCVGITKLSDCETGFVIDLQNNHVTVRQVLSLTYRIFI